MKLSVHTSVTVGSVLVAQHCSPELPQHLVLTQQQHAQHVCAVPPQRPKADMLLVLLLAGWYYSTNRVQWLMQIDRMARMWCCSSA